MKYSFKYGFKSSVIAEEIGVSKRTINREKKRGIIYGLRNSDYSTRDEYVEDAAQKDADYKNNNKGPALKIRILF